MKFSFRAVKNNKEKILTLLYILILFLGIVGSYNAKKDEVVATFSMPVSKKVVVIDAGHGGWDPDILA